MHKEQFLSELREYLSILDSQEQEDILAEYAQHIDMKMQKGLSEEEAIRDFGPMKELAAEILEAYHVNFDSAVKLPARKHAWLFFAHRPRYSEKTAFGGQDAGRGAAAQGEDSAEGSEGNRDRSFWRRQAAWLRRQAARVMHGIRGGCRWFGRKCRAAGCWLGKPFLKRRQDTVDTVEDTGEKGNAMEQTEMKHTGKRHIGMRAICRKTGRGIILLWRWFLSFCIFWLKFMWNAGWLLFSLFCACAALLILVCVGAMLVFLVQGYPFVGIFIISVGGLLCFGALAWGAFSLLIRKQQPRLDGEESLSA